jgi:hypothetical protein
MGDSWQPWLDQLDAACAAGDRARAAAHLEHLWRFRFHEERASRPECWDRLFALLVQLVTDDDPALREGALHYVWVVMGAQYGPPWDSHGPAERAASVRRRTGQLLPALAAAVDAGRLSLPEVLDALVHVEELADLGPQPLVDRFLADRPEDGALVRAAHLAYRGGREGGPDAATLRRTLDDEVQLVRAYAARALGALYAAGGLDEAPEPPLGAMVAELTARELARPGIAGPFLSNWYDGGLADFERQSGVILDEWLCTLLAGRTGPEPETLPCSNGIDFFVHELFGGRAGLVERLVALGHQRLAVEAATEVDEPIEELVPVLRQLAASRDDEVARPAAWQLARLHRELVPAAASRGLVERRVLGGGAELFLTPHPDTNDGAASGWSAVVHPAGGVPFDDAAAELAEAEVLAPARRGELAVFGMPGDGNAPGPWCHGRSELRRYRSGALLERRGELATRRWERLLIVWRARPPADWANRTD